MAESSILFKRIVSGLIGAGFLVGIVLLDRRAGWLSLPLFLTVCGLATLGIREFCRLFKRVKEEESRASKKPKKEETLELQPPFGVGLLVGLSLIFFFYWLNFTGRWEQLVTLLVTILIVFAWMSAASEVSGYFTKDLIGKALKAVGISIVGGFYVGGLLSFWILLRNLANGVSWLIFALLVTWACDVGAFFVGREFGRMKLWPRVSPYKTVEGAVAGLSGSVLVAVGLAGVLNLARLESLVAGLLIGVFAQLGDLLESGIKRYAGVKDSGRLIPGHGGILDRFDSLLFSVPVLYVYLVYFVR